MSCVSGKRVEPLAERTGTAPRDTAAERRACGAGFTLLEAFRKPRRYVGHAPASTSDRPPGRPAGRPARQKTFPSFVAIFETFT